MTPLAYSDTINVTIWPDTEQVKREAHLKILRTPDACFEGLPDYSYAPNWTDIASGTGEVLRIHAVDEGPRDAAPVFLMHGEPSWSYLYRHMISGLVAKGHRVVSRTVAEIQ